MEPQSGTELYIYAVGLFFIVSKNYLNAIFVFLQIIIDCLVIEYTVSKR